MELDLNGLPELEDWLSGAGDSGTFGFLMANVTVTEAAVLSTLLWPDFVEFRGCTFLKFKFDESNVDMWLERLSEDFRAVEAVVNQVHLWDVFSPGSPEEYRVLSQLAHRVSDMWRSALHIAFPDRIFLVLVLDDPEEYGPTLTFTSH
jgi:hypothetical protein